MITISPKKGVVGNLLASSAKFRDGYEQVYRQKKQIAHGLHVILPANLHKTAPHGLFSLNFWEFATHRWKMVICIPMQQGGMA